MLSIYSKETQEICTDCVSFYSKNRNKNERLQPATVDESITYFWLDYITHGHDRWEPIYLVSQAELLPCFSQSHS